MVYPSEYKSIRVLVIRRKNEYENEQDKTE